VIKHCTTPEWMLVHNPVVGSWL